MKEREFYKLIDLMTIKERQEYNRLEREFYQAPNDIGRHYIKYKKWENLEEYLFKLRDKYKNRGKL